MRLGVLSPASLPVIFSSEKQAEQRAPSELFIMSWTRSQNTKNPCQKLPRNSILHLNRASLISSYLKERVIKNLSTKFLSVIKTARFPGWTACQSTIRRGGFNIERPI